MKVRRTEKIKTNTFREGDIIKFKLADGEKVKMLAVKSELDGMVFCSVDCLKAEYCMNPTGTNAGGWADSELRKKLNSEILERFPKKIKKLLVPFENGDLLRIPTEREIFGRNPYGVDEPEAVEQWKAMKQRKNRIASQGLNGGWEWYWLQNPAVVSTATFASVNAHGNANCNAASNVYGVRPVAKIKNQTSAPACQVQEDDGPFGEIEDAEQ